MIISRRLTVQVLNKHAVTQALTDFSNPKAPITTPEHTGPQTLICDLWTHYSLIIVIDWISLDTGHGRWDTAEKRMFGVMLNTHIWFVLDGDLHWFRFFNTAGLWRCWKYLCYSFSHSWVGWLAQAITGWVVSCQYMFTWVARVHSFGKSHATSQSSSNLSDVPDASERLDEINETQSLYYIVKHTLSFFTLFYKYVLYFFTFNSEVHLTSFLLTYSATKEPYLEAYPLKLHKNKNVICFLKFFLWNHSAKKIIWYHEALYV